MDLKLLFGIISSVLAVICFIPYFVGIYKGNTKPHIYSWLIWSILQTVAVLAQLKDGSGAGSWALAIGAVFCFSIFLLSFKYGTKNISTFDTICLFLALISVGFYLFIDNPLWSVVLVTLTDFLGFLPTYRKGYAEPETEALSTYGISALSNAFSLGALGNFSLTTSLYLIFLVFANSTFATLVAIRRRALAANN